jgi:predicted DNA-binding transcriptional regulator AlpA
VTPGAAIVTGQDELLLASEVASITSVNTKTLAAWRARGEGPEWVKLGGHRIAYPRSAVAAWLDQQITKTREIRNAS